MGRTPSAVGVDFKRPGDWGGLLSNKVKRQAGRNCGFLDAATLEWFAGVTALGKLLGLDFCWGFG